MFHLSQTPLKKIRNPKNLGFSFKPEGCLWVACGKEWEEFVEDEMEAGYDRQYKHKYKIELDLDRIIVLKTKKDISDFNQKYTVEIEDTPQYKNFLIDWNQVRKETGKYGIFIKNPHIKTARREFPWYSSFDVCSAGIWDNRAILKIEEVEKWKSN